MTPPRDAGADHLREARCALFHQAHFEATDSCPYCGPHVHFWDLGAPNDEGVTHGTCRGCGAERTFTPQSELTAGRWRNKRNAQKAR